MQEAEGFLLSFRSGIDTGDGAIGPVEDDSVSRAEHVRYFLCTDNTRQSLKKQNPPLLPLYLLKDMFKRILTYSRATTAPCEINPPSSVTTPARRGK